VASTDDTRVVAVTPRSNASLFRRFLPEEATCQVSLGKSSELVSSAADPILLPLQYSITDDKPVLSRPFLKVCCDYVNNSVTVCCRSMCAINGSNSRCVIAFSFVLEGPALP